MIKSLYLLYKIIFVIYYFYPVKINNNLVIYILKKIIVLYIFNLEKFFYYKYLALKYNHKTFNNIQNLFL